MSATPHTSSDRLSGLLSRSSLRVRSRWIALLCLAWISAACGLVAPDPSEIRTWSAAPPEAAPAVEAVPLEVLVKTPVGQISTSQAINAVFNQPVVAMTDLDAQKSKAALTLLPPIEGTFHWLGTSTLSFVPSKGFQPATRYTVTIPADLTTFGGVGLAAEASWTFDTERPAVSGVAPYQGEQWIRPSQPVLLTFNQPIELSSTQGRVKLLAADGKEIPTTVRAPDPTKADEAKAIQGVPPNQAVYLVPNAPLPLNQTITVQVDAGLKSTLGPLPGEEGFTSSFTTYGPFSVKGAECGYAGECRPSSALNVSFSNPLPEGITPAEAAALITITPAVEASADPYLSWDNSSASYYFKFKPDTVYSLTIKSGLKDRFGQTLAADFKQSIAVGSYEPQLRISTGNGVVERGMAMSLPGVAMNYTEVNIRTALLTEDQLVGASDDLWNTEKRDALFMGAQKPWKTILKPAGKRNDWRLFEVPFASSMGTTPSGVLLYELYPGPVKPDQYGNVYKDLRYGLLQITNLGLTTKLSADETLVWVTSLADAKPQPGATIKLRNASNTVVWTGTTDAQGLARGPGLRDIPRPDTYSPLLVTASLGDDFAFLNAGEGDYEIRPWHFNIPYQWDWKDYRYETHLFTDRGVYRAGDTVHIKGLVREDIKSQWTVPNTTRFHAKVFNSRDEVILERADIALSDFGGFTLDLPLAADAPLGSYTIAMDDKTVGDRWDAMYTTSFRVEAYRAPEFKVKVEGSADSVIAGQPVEGVVQGDYLFGAPMSGAAVAWTALKNRAWFSPPGEWPGLSFVDEHVDDSGSYNTLADQRQGTLDASGAHRYTLEVPAGSLKFPMRYTLDAEVKDLNRQTVAGSDSILVHPGDRYLGVGFDGWMAPTTTPVVLNFVSVTPKGEQVGGTDAAIKVYQRNWSTTRTQGPDGDWSYTSAYEDKEVGGCAVTSSASMPVPCEVSLKDSGPGYYFARVTGKDSRGVDLSSSRSFYAYGDGEARWEYKNDSTIDLVLDRTNYKPGDKARILIKSPWPDATALITTERSGVLTTEVRTLTSNAETLTLDITEDHIPNVFVSVALLQKRTAPFDPKAASDAGRPAMRLGYAMLPVAVEQRRLAVDVSVSSEEVLPGSEAQVRVQVKDWEGKGVRSEVALYAVDEGVLSLTGYQTPDSMQVFYKPRPLGVGMSESRLHFFSFSHKGLKGGDPAGGGDGESGSPFRSVFSTTPLWVGQLVTADDGTATAQIKLPDNMTTFRVMAVAASAKSQFGKDETPIRVTKPLLLRSALPRFARIDDEFEASAVINNRGTEPVTVTLKMDADPAFIKSLEPAERSVQVEAGRGKEVRFKVRALREGQTPIRFSISPPAPEGSDPTKNPVEIIDGVQTQLKIKAPVVTESVATSGIVDKPVLEQIQAPNKVHTSIGGLDVSLSSTALVDLGESLRYIVDYPFGCTEQMSSKLVTLMSMRPMLASFNLLEMSEADLDAAAQTLIASLTKHQDWGGGFYMWPSANSTRLLDHGSVYAVHALSIAAERGLPVPEEILRKGTEFIHTLSTTPNSTYGTSAGSWLATRAYALYVLAKLGKPDLSTLTSLFEARAKIGLIGQSYLLLALVASSGDQTQVETLKQEITNAAAIDTHGVYFGDPRNTDLGVIWSSDVRSTSLVLMALSASDPKHPLLPKIVSWLQSQREHGHWNNTQDNAIASLALLTYFEQFEAEEPNMTARLFLGDTLRFEQPFVGRSQSVITHRVLMPDLQAADSQNVVFDRTGTGRLYYTMRLTYAPSDRVLPAREEGFTILRTYESLETGQEVTSFKAGDVIKVRLVIVVPRDREEVAVRDSLPAGLEPISLDFQTTSAALAHKLAATEAAHDYDSGTASDYDDYSWYWRPSFDHIEKRDDVVQMFASYLPAGVYEHVYLTRATTFGTFAAPAAQIEEMYTPEVFGRSTSAVFDVK